MAHRDPYEDDEVDVHGVPISEYTGDSGIDSSPAEADIAGTPENPDQPAAGTL